MNRDDIVKENQYNREHSRDRSRSFSRSSPKAKDIPQRRERSRSRSRSNDRERERDRERRGNGHSNYRNSDRYNRRSRSPNRNNRRRSKSPSAENKGNTLYISNLSRNLREEELEERFGKFGKLENSNIVRDPFTKDSRGFGFVTFESEKDAEAALEALNKTEIDGRVINVEVSKRNKPRKTTPGVYLGPSNNSRRFKRYSPRRRYRSRSRSFNRDRPRERGFTQRRSYRSRSRSGSYRRRY